MGAKAATLGLLHYLEFISIVSGGINYPSPLLSPLEEATGKEI